MNLRDPFKPVFRHGPTLIRVVALLVEGALFVLLVTHHLSRAGWVVLLTLLAAELSVDVFRVFALARRKHVR